MAAPKLTYQSTCRFCGMTLTAEPFAPIVGEGFDPRIIEFVSKLQKHVEKKHPKEFETMLQQVMRFTGFATVGAFDIQDPLLVTIQEQIRADLHRKTRKTYIMDEHIEAKIEQFGLGEFSSNDLRKLLRDMRDLLCEEGSYAPVSSTAQKPLVSL